MYFDQENIIFFFLEKKTQHLSKVPNTVHLHITVDFIMPFILQILYVAHFINSYGIYTI